jgi:hypothetical protein
MTLHKFARHIQNCVEHQHCISGKGGGIAALNVYTTEEHRRYKKLKRYKYAEFRVDEAQQKMTG